MIYLLLNALNWPNQDQAQPAAFNHLEFLLWRNESASSR